MYGFTVKVYKKGELIKNQLTIARDWFEVWSRAYEQHGDCMIHIKREGKKQ